VAPKPRATLAAEAQRDLRAIYRWVARESGAERARRLVASVRERADIFAGAPLAGRSRPEIGDGIRSFVSGSYVVFYTPDRNGIVVARVIHGSREVDKAWRERDINH
jgi:toxin ParE1/3/4